MSDDRRCEGCDRRGFLRELAGLAAGVAVTFTIDGQRLGAVTALAPAAGQGADERRYPIPAADQVSIDHENGVIVSRFQQHVYAFSLACPHQNTALRWRPADVRFQCPRHESKYQPDGTFISGRATRSMDRFPIRRDGDAIVVSLARLIQSDENPTEWAAARVDL